MSGSDEQLLVGIRSADRSAFAEFYDRHGPKVFAFLLKLLRHRDEAEDTLQEVFLHVWNRSDQYDQKRARPLAWLVCVARSRALDRLRRRKRTEQDLEGAGAEPVQEDQIAQELCREERASATRSALARLVAEQREVIQLAFYSELTHEGIAARLELPLGTVKTRIRLGMRKLREILNVEEGACS